MRFTNSRIDTDTAGCSNNSCIDGLSRMADPLSSSDAEDEAEKMKWGAYVEEKTLGLNKHAQQKFLETAETPSLLTILSSLLQDMLNDSTSSTESGSSSSSEGYCSQNAGGIQGAQQKTQREREKRPLAEDVEYLRAMASPSQQEQQQPERSQQQQRWQTHQGGKGQEEQQNGQHCEQGSVAAASQLVQQKKHCEHIKSESQQPRQQESASEMAEIQAMLKALVEAPEAAENCCHGEQQETEQQQHASPRLEAVAFAVEEDSPAVTVTRDDLGCQSGSTDNNENADVCSSSSSRRGKESTSGDSVSKDDGCAEQLQQQRDNMVVEQQWCSSEETLLQEEGQEDVDSMNPTRCSSGDEQQWGSAAAGGREGCGRAAEVLEQHEQRDVGQEQLLQQERLKREQQQQAQLDELMWAVAAAFEIQQLHPQRVRERRRRLREKTSGRENTSGEQNSSRAEDGCNNSSSSNVKDGGSDGDCNASAADSSNSNSRHSSKGDTFCPCCRGGGGSPCSSSGSTTAGRGSTSVTLPSSSTSCKGITGSRSTGCTSTTLRVNGGAQGCSSSSSSSHEADSIDGSSTVHHANQSCRDICMKEETASSVSGGDRNTARRETCSYSGSANTENTTDSKCSHSSNSSSSADGNYLEFSSNCRRYENGSPASQNMGSEEDHAVITSSSRSCSGDREGETQTCESHVGTVKRFKRDHDGSTSSSNSSVVNSDRESCTVSSSSSYVTNTGDHNSSVSSSSNRGNNSLEEEAAAAVAACASQASVSRSCPSSNNAIKERDWNSSSSVDSNLLRIHRGKRSLGDGSSTCCCSRCSNNGSFPSIGCSKSSTNCVASNNTVATENREEDNKCDLSIGGDPSGVLPASGACQGADAAPTNTCSSEAAAAADEFPAWRCCCGEGGAEAPAAVWKSRGLLQYDAVYDRWRMFLTQFAPSGMALAVCFGKSYLFHVLHESLWQLLEELRLTAAGETPQRLRTFVLRLAAAAGLSSTHAEQLLSKTLFQHGNPADSILPSETGLGFLHRDAGGAREEQLGIINFCCITNDRQPQHLLQLLTIKSIFSRQLPKMPREYIVRLVFDRNHFTFCLCKRGRVTGGVCFRPYFKERFAEIAFLAVTSTEQVKGYGTRLMNHLKEHVKKSNIEYFLTYADNFALGYFRKQGFSSRITMPRDRWVGYIKDYDGGTLMECKISQKINYLQLSQLLAKQKLAVKRFIEVCSPAPLCPPITFWKENPGKLLSPLEIPALVKLGYTATHWLSMQPLLPAGAVRQSTGELREQQSGRRAGSAAGSGSSTTSGANAMDDEKKHHRESRMRGADHGDGRPSASSSSGSWWRGGGTPAAKDADSITTAAAASSGVNRMAGLHPYLHHFGAGAGSSVVSGSAGQSFKARVAALLSCLEKHSSSWPFRKPVSINEAPDYYEVICRPMDIGSMKKKNRAGEYQTVGAIRADLQLMFDNCRLYNSQDTIYYKYADELQAFIWPKLNVLEEPAAA